MYALVGTLTFTGSYATGGDALDLSLYFKRIGVGKGIRFVSDIRGNDPEYDEANKKLKLYARPTPRLQRRLTTRRPTASPVPVLVVGR
jgi:hypothetical protein